MKRSIWFLLWVALLSAQGIKQLSLNEGLSQSVVFDVAQDSFGYMWIATQDGLNHFDGYEFKVFRFNPEDTASLTDNWVTRVLAMDSCLWIGTHHGGLNRLNLHTGKMEHFFQQTAHGEILSGVWIQDMVRDATGRVWIATWGKGVLGFDPRNPRAGLIKLQKRLPSGHVTALAYSQGQLVIATRRGVSRYTIQKDRVENFFFNNDTALSVDNFFTSLIPWQGGWLLGSLKGIKYWDGKGKVRSFTQYQGLFQQDVVITLLRDSEGTLWVGTKQNGLFRLSEHRKERYHRGADNSHRLQADYIRTLFEDNQGNLWVGTWGGGVHIIRISYPEFQGIMGKKAQQLFSSTMVNALTKDSQRNLWVGTNQQGITVLNAKGRKIRQLNVQHPRPEFRISDNRIHALLTDKKGNIWIGTQRGLDQWQDNKIVHHLTTLNKQVLVWKFYQDRYGVLWIAHPFGLLQYHPQEKWWREYSVQDGLAGNDVTTMIEDHLGRLWVGSRGNGITIITFDAPKANRKARSFFYLKYTPGDHQGLSSNNILSFLFDSDSVMWVGTNQGLNRVDIKHDRITHFYQRDGLPNDVIYSILRDRRGNLWLATNRGLSCMNPREGNFRNYTPKHGLQSYEFNQGACYQDQQGRLYFGGIKGLNWFDPLALNDRERFPRVVLTNIMADGISINQGGINQVQRIRLPYKIHTLSFKFSALEFFAPEQVRYSCFLLGIDQQWHDLGMRPAITYSNVQPGEYRLFIKATNTRGEWSPYVTGLQVQIPPPFWKTWWFILLSIATVAAILTFLITYRVKQMLALERFQNQIAADLHDEIGAGLSEINILSALLETRLQHSKDEKSKLELSKIGERSRMLMNEMNDIIWLIKPRKDDVGNLFSHLKESFNEVLEAKGIQFHLRITERVKQLALSMEEKHHLYLLFKEAINNSVKYSGAGNIWLHSEVKHGWLEVELKDDGRGFEPHKVSAGNGLRNMEQRAQRLKAHFSLTSKPNEGTYILLRTRIGRSKRKGKKSV